MAINNSKIAVLSGKGGTGKTFVSVNLANVIKNCTYLDCDVEEPNGRLFLKPQNTTSTPVYVKNPYIDNNKCTLCRKCVDFCKFNALCATKTKILLFDEVCHACGGCSLCCPEHAITEVKKEIGHIEYGKSKNINVYTGILNTLETSGVPIIDDLLKIGKNKTSTVIIDCPPGSGCAVMDSIKDATYAILVAEPTIFGVDNLEMVYNLVKLFDKKCGLVINKCNDDNNPAKKFAIKNNIDILAEIPYDNEIAKHNSVAEIATNHIDSLKSTFDMVAQKVLKESAL